MHSRTSVSIIIKKVKLAKHVGDTEIVTYPREVLDFAVKNNNNNKNWYQLFILSKKAVKLAGLLLGSPILWLDEPAKLSLYEL